MVIELTALRRLCMEKHWKTKKQLRDRIDELKRYNDYLRDEVATQHGKYLATRKQSELLFTQIDLSQKKLFKNPDFLERVNRQKPRTMQRLADCWYEGNSATYGRSAHYNESRYHMCNLHAAFTKGTVEFRLFQFSDPANGRQNGIHAGEMKAYIQLCLAMSELAKEVAYASPRPQQTDNEKYAMRCWMLRLGFIGDEFATAREILLKNMDGNCAWRSGH